MSGEQDNVYVPGFGEDKGDPVENWDGLEGAGSVVKDAEERFQTPLLASGTYTFDLSGTEDADLYVRVGDAPTVQNYDCRPYLSGSNERCTVEITTPAVVHLMVRGWNASSDYQLSGN